MHSADDLNYQRGYEWWLMTEAKKRNPDIKLYGLPWAFPSWVGNGTGNPYAFPNLTASYVVKWVEGAKSVYNLDIDYVGIWNERNYNIEYIETLRSLLDSSGFSNTMIVAPDAGWDIASDILDNPTFAQTIYAIGCHYPGTYSTQQAVSTNKPLWASEDMSTYNDLRGAECWARVLNQNFINGNMTTTISWNLIASYYHGLPWYGTGIMSATEPWSGHYDNINVGLIWASAHTTHFAQPGWKYLTQGQGSGLLQNGGSYVTLTNGSDFAIIIEKMQWDHSICIRPGLNEYNAQTEEVVFFLEAQWNNLTTLYVWQTIFGWEGDQQTNSSFFLQLQPITVVDGVFSITVNPDEMYTISTLNNAQKADIPVPPPSQPFPSVYFDDFESYNVSSEASNFADQAGAFEIFASNNASHGNVMRQSVPNVPICWSGDFAPFSVIGDTQWSDTIVSVEVLVETTGAAYVGARCGGCCVPSGVFLSVSVTSQQWALTNNIDVENPSSIIQSGPLNVAANTWYNLSLSVVGPIVNAWIGQDQVLNGYELSSISTGWAAIGTSVQQNQVYTYAQFDNFQVYGYQAKCQDAIEGSTLSVINCGGLNGGNTQWILNNGVIQLASNPSLCVTGPNTTITSQYIPSLQLCTPNNPAQQFNYVPSTQYPFSTIGQASNLLNINNNVVVLDPVQEGSGITTCSQSNQAQNISFTGSQGTAGQIIYKDQCLSGACTNNQQGCYPLVFVECNSSDTTQSFTLSSSSQLVIASNGFCLDVDGQTGPMVGAYPCDGGQNQHWNVGQDYIEVSQPSGQCLSIGYFGSGAQVVVNEFGNGELTFYGAFVTDQCIGACTLV